GEQSAKQAIEKAFGQEQLAKLAVENALAGEQKAKNEVEGALKREQEAMKRENQLKDELDQSYYIHRINLAARDWDAGDVSRARQLLQDCPEKRRHWEWHYLNRVVHPELYTLGGFGGPVERVAYSPDGKLLAALDKEGTVKL